jgi:hypothetical protein
MNILPKIQRASLLSVVALGLLITSTAPSFAGQFQRNHPRRAQVLHRDNGINNRVNADIGQLGGHYNQLKREDRGIRHQEQRDARMNGGHITKGEQHQINHEENHVNNQIRRDHN